VCAPGRARVFRWIGSDEVRLVYVCIQLQEQVIIFIPIFLGTAKLLRVPKFSAKYCQIVEVSKE